MAQATIDKILETEYSKEFDEKRKNAMAMSFYKYGPAKENFSKGMVDAIATLKKCLKKFEETGNLDYMVDIANYAMIRFMYPADGEHYTPTDSKESAGVVGMTIKEMESYYADHKNDY